LNYKELKRAIKQLQHKQNANPSKNLGSATGETCDNEPSEEELARKYFFFQLYKALTIYSNLEISILFHA